MKHDQPQPGTTDLAAQFRSDLQRFPARIVLASAKRHLMSLRLLRKDVPDKAKAIADVAAFLKEHQS